VGASPRTPRTDQHVGLESALEQGAQHSDLHRAEARPAGQHERRARPALTGSGSRQAVRAAAA